MVTFAWFVLNANANFTAGRFDIAQRAHLATITSKFAYMGRCYCWQWPIPCLHGCPSGHLNSLLLDKEVKEKAKEHKKSEKEIIYN